MSDKFTFEIVDQLAHEYGWSVKYIQNLDMQEINSLLEAIIERKKNDAMVLRHILISVLSGKPGSNMLIEDDSEALNELINRGIAKIDRPQEGKK